MFTHAGNVLESYSSEFFVAFGRNDANGRDSPTLTLFISSIEPDPVLVTVETLRGFSFSGFATNNETLSVEIPNTFQVFSSDERDKGIRVTADGQSNIVVYGLNYEMFLMLSWPSPAIASQWTSMNTMVCHTLVEMDWVRF